MNSLTNNLNCNHLINYNYKGKKITSKAHATFIKFYKSLLINNVYNNRNKASKLHDKMKEKS